MAGEPTFFEIGVADKGRARAFYGGLFDWRFEPGPSGDGYGISTSTVPGGMHGNDEGASPLLFFGVADLEAAMARVRDLGGHAEALESRADEPRERSFRRFALCRDDQGSSFGLHQPPAAKGEGARAATARRPTIDHVTLRAGNLAASRRFYEAALAPLGTGLEFAHEGLLAFGSGEGGGSSSTPASGPSPGFTSPSPLRAGRPWTVFTPRRWRREGATTAHRDRGPSTMQATTARTCSTLTATTSRRSTTPFLRVRSVVRSLESRSRPATILPPTDERS